MYEDYAVIDQVGYDSQVEFLWNLVSNEDTQETDNVDNMYFANGFQSMRKRIWRDCQFEDYWNQKSNTDYLQNIWNDFNNNGTIIEEPSIVPATISSHTNFDKIFDSRVINIENNQNYMIHLSKKKSKPKTDTDYCRFCKNNEPESDNYRNHRLKDEYGNCACPILRAYECPNCHESGDRAHTLKYCPKKRIITKEDAERMDQRNNIRKDKHIASAFNNANINIYLPRI